MPPKIAIGWAFFLPFVVFGQPYTSYFTGNKADASTNPSGGVCMMGGATEDDNAMKWFLQRADGGDVLVLRASGSDGYNDYLYNELGIPVNSVETIVCHDVAASNEAYIHQKIQQAEAIWFAGGDQWTYVSYWRNTPVDSLVNQAILLRNIVVGGTSAGMAILGAYYFSAQNGTVTSATALANPYAPNVTVDSTAFLRNKHLTRTITDTHFDSPDRKGRLAVFLSRIYADYDVPGKAIACDEYTAVCIQPDGVAKVFGGFPSSDDNAYFIQLNCELSDPAPEKCSAGTPLTWNLGGKALKVYQIKGTEDGSKSFNLNDWKTGVGGQWRHWSVENGSLLQQSGTALNCSTLSTAQPAFNLEINLYPNPASNVLQLSRAAPGGITGLSCIPFNILGEQLPLHLHVVSPNLLELDLSAYAKGIYFLKIYTADNHTVTRIFVRG